MIIKKFLKSDKFFDIINTSLMCLALIIFIWPLLFVVSASFSDSSAVWSGKVIIFPVDFSVRGYVELLKLEQIWIGYRNTIFYTVAGTLINIVLTICAAYPLSRKDFMPRTPMILLLMFTMYFNGGLIPNYLVVDKLGMVNTPFAMLIPGAISVFNVIITKTYFENNIPSSLKDAAEIDGANTAQFLIKIVLPLSTPIIAVMALYYGVAHWNTFFSALIYLSNKELFPLQLILRDILIQTNSVTDMAMSDPDEIRAKLDLAEKIKFSVIIVASVPVLMIYPLIQKHFVKGIMIGALKG